MPFDIPVDNIDTSPAIFATVIYNAFDPTDRTLAELDWVEGRTLFEYLEGLPADLDWVVVTPEGVFERSAWGEKVLQPDDRIAVMLSPNKGIGQIFAMVAMLALAVVAPYIGGLVAATAFATGLGATLGISAAAIGSIAAGLVMVLGSALITALMPKPSQKNETQEVTQSPSYSLSGAKNTSAEGTTVPFVYGEFRVAGNRINFYTENSYTGLSQVAYLQYVVSEGEIQSISDVEINGQALSSFTNVTLTTRMGTLDQPPVNWFASSIQPYINGATLSLNPLDYTTLSNIDRFRLDIAFPQGLYQINQSKGVNENRTVKLNVAYSKVGTDIWQTLSNDDVWVSIDPNDSISPICTGIRVTVQVTGDNDNPTTPYSVTANYSNSTGEQSNSNTSWGNENAGQIGAGAGSVGQIGAASGVISNRYTVDPSNQTTFTAGTVTHTFEINNMQRAGYTISATGGTVVAIEVLTSNPLEFKSKERSRLNFSIFSPPLEYGSYIIRVTRSNAQSSSAFVADEVILESVNEIQTDPVSYIGSATYAIRIQLTDQLNSEPTVTALVKGRKVNIYDKNGVILTNQWSSNPADIALDILLNWRNRYGMSASRIDFISFDRFRQHCVTNNLTFNGVFDFQTTMWDALMFVMRAGRANIIMSGVRWSVILDAPSEPVMMFTMNNILKDSFNSHWLGVENRYNSIEIQYYDKKDSFRRHSRFAIDYDALAAGEPIRSTSINGVGIVDAQRAQDEAQLQFNKNKYLRQGCSFDAPIEAIGCSVGDIVYIQHDMPQWGYAATVTAVGGGGSITIDTDIPFTNESNWRILLVEGAKNVLSRAISYTSGNQIGFGSYTTLSGAHRILIDSKDYEVLDEVVVGGDLVLTLDRDLESGGAGYTAAFYKTDLISEGTLTPIATNVNAGAIGGGMSAADDFDILKEDGGRLMSEEATVSGTRSLVISGWISTTGTPAVGDRVMIGQITKFKKPFWITKISLKDKLIRSIEAIEYNATIYDSAGAISTPNYSALSLYPQHVSHLRAWQTETQLQGGAMTYSAVCSWRAPINDQRIYAGANVMVSVDSSPFAIVGSIPKGQAEITIPAESGTLVRFKVISYDINGVLADLNSAPITAVQIGNNGRVPAAPSNVTATPGLRQIALRWDLTYDDYNKSVEVWENPFTNQFSGAYLQWSGSANYMVRTGIRMGEKYNYWLRTLSITGVYSDFVGPYEAEPTYALTDDIGLSILNAAHFASTIQPVELFEHLPDTGNYENRQVYITTPGQQILWVFRDGIWTHMVDEIDASIIQGKLENAQILSLEASKITGQLTSTQLASIESTKITGQLTSTQITDNAVTTAKLEAGSITTAKLAANAVTANELAANSVTTAKLEAGSITTAKLAAGAIDAASLATDSVTANKVAANSITTTKLAASAVTANELAANSVIAGKVAAGAISAAQIVAGQIKATHLAAEEIITLAAQIKDAVITTAHIGTAVITSAKIGSLEVDTSNIANSAVSDTVTAKLSSSGGIGIGPGSVMQISVYVPTTSSKVILICKVHSLKGESVGPGVVMNLTRDLSLSSESTLDVAYSSQYLANGEEFLMLTTDAPTVGWHTYDIYLYSGVGATSATIVAFVAKK